MGHLQVPCLRHGLPLCVPASHILSYALSVESKSEFLQVPPMNICSHKANGTAAVIIIGSRCQCWILDNLHLCGDSVCIWAELDVQYGSDRDVSRCRLWSLDVDLPCLALLCPLEPISTLSGG